MERITNDLSTLRTEETKRLERTSPTSRSYAAKVAEILTKAWAGTLSTLEDGEFKLAVGVWTEILEGHVPEARLNDCYVRAVRNRKNGFPMAASELCAMWNEIRESEMHSTPHRDMSKQLAGDVCERCWATGYEIIKRAKYNYAKTCDHIEYTEVFEL